MITATPRLDPRVVKATVPYSRLTVLGTTADGDLYASFGGREFVLGGPVQVSDLAVRDHSIIVAERVTTTIDDTAMEENIHRIGREVALGTWASIVAKTDRAKRRAAVRDRRRPVDLLSDVGRRQPLAIPAAGLEGVTATGLRSHITSPAQPDGALIEGRMAVSGGAALLRYFEKRADLRVTAGGRLLVQARGGRLTAADLAAITASERLLVATMTGSTLRCELEHPKGQAPEATTVVAIGIAVCGPHARGEL